MSLSYLSLKEKSMKKIALLTTTTIFFVHVFSFAQKTISEGTLTYNISMQSANKQPLSNGLSGAAVTIYLKGALSRTDMVSNLGNERIIYDANAGTAVILREYSGQKLMITLTKENWQEKNRKSDGIIFSYTNEPKEILSYSCDKATAKLNDGSNLTVFYTKELNTLNSSYDPTFKNLHGFPVQYEFESGKLKFVYTLSKIDYNTVPASKFELPKAGYRILTYNENRIGNKEGKQ
jgi:hypothetical protein